MDRVTDRLTMWALRSVATMMLLGGISALVAGAPLYGMISDSPVARAIAGVVFQISGVFMVSGAAAMYLSRAGGPTLPNERLTTSAADRPDVGGLLIGLAIVLVALPLWLLLLLQPFLAEWSVVARLLAASEIWQGANANMSGVILVPLAGAVTPPLFELAALFAFVVASAVLLALLLSRSRRFPRIYLVCGVLLSALVIASVRGADAAMMAGDAVRQLIEGSSASAEESAQIDGRSRPLHEHRWFNRTGSGVGVVRLSRLDAGDVFLSKGSNNVCDQRRRSRLDADGEHGDRPRNHHQASALSRLRLYPPASSEVATACMAASTCRHFSSEKRPGKIMNPCGLHNAFSQPSSTLIKRSCVAIDTSARRPASSRVRASMPV